LLHVTSTPPNAGAPPSKPALVCLPMSPRSGRDFDELAGLLARNRWVHAPDLPGYGGSDAPPAPPSLEDYAAALIEGIYVLDPLRRNAQVDILGQHTGAGHRNCTTGAAAGAQNGVHRRADVCARGNRNAA
jgi:pimeloyl-ACP methyl ester carboxylesterase